MCAHLRLFSPKWPRIIPDHWRCAYLRANRDLKHDCCPFFFLFGGVYVRFFYVLLSFQYFFYFFYFALFRFVRFHFCSCVFGFLLCYFEVSEKKMPLHNVIFSLIGILSRQYAFLLFFFLSLLPNNAVFGFFFRFHLQLYMFGALCEFYVSR